MRQARDQPDEMCGGEPRPQRNVSDVQEEIGPSSVGTEVGAKTLDGVTQALLPDPPGDRQPKTHSAAIALDRVPGQLPAPLIVVGPGHRDEGESDGPALLEDVLDHVLGDPGSWLAYVDPPSGVEPREVQKEGTLGPDCGGQPPGKTAVAAALWRLVCRCVADRLDQGGESVPGRRGGVRQGSEFARHRFQDRDVVPISPLERVVERPICDQTQLLVQPLASMR